MSVILEFERGKGIVRTIVVSDSPIDAMDAHQLLAQCAFEIRALYDAAKSAGELVGGGSNGNS